MYIDPQIQSQSFFQSLKQGSVFRLKGEPPFESDQFHVFIVLNFDPSTGKILLLANGTTQYAKRREMLRRAGLDVETTTVYIPAQKYPFFSRDTMIDCNTIHELEITSVDFANRRIIPIPGYLASDDLNLILSAVESSAEVLDYQKALIIGKSLL